MQEPPLDESQPGDFHFKVNPHDGKMYCAMHLPCQHGWFTNLPVAIGPHADGYWGWNGKTDKPTLTPSIEQKRVLRYEKNAEGKDVPVMETLWHGHLTDGEFVSC